MSRLEFEYCQQEACQPPGDRCSGKDPELMSEPISGPGDGSDTEVVGGGAGGDGVVVLVEEDLLLEEISIDGMCGVY
jgi:mycofactocin precursor